MDVDELHKASKEVVLCAEKQNDIIVNRYVCLSYLQFYRAL